MRDLLEAGIEPYSLDISSGFAGPGFEASALHNEVSESIFYLQLQFEYQAPGPLVQEDSPTRTVLDITQSFDVVFSSDRLSDRFTGKPVSQTTGLYYEYQRWYDPSIGRFISTDPDPGYLSDPQSLNPYVYVENLPTGLIDPTGEDSCWIFSIVCDTVASGATGLWNGASNAWNSLTPEEQQGIILGVGIALAIPTGGTDMLLVGGLLAAGSVGVYADVTYAMGGTPSLAGMLGAANLGFGIGAGVYGFGTLLDSALSIETASAGEALAAGVRTNDLVNTSDFWDTVESSSSWSRASFRTPLDSLAYHFDTHAPPGLGAGGYTRDALTFRNMFWDLGERHWIYSLREWGWKIDMPWGPAGIYRNTGEIISFWYE